MLLSLENVRKIFKYGINLMISAGSESYNNTRNFH